MGNSFKVDEDVHLEPCRVCGNVAYIEGMFIPTQDGEINAYHVGCEKCKVSFIQYWGYDRIVEKWNKRVHG